MRGKLWILSFNILLSSDFLSFDLSRVYASLFKGLGIYIRVSSHWREKSPQGET